MNVWIKLILFIGAVFSLLPVNVAESASYYINYSTGNDSTGDGSIGTPWKTCTNIEGASFLSPGDSVLLAAGTEIAGSDAHCIIRSRGSSLAPITVTRYGEGADPIFNGSVPQADIAGWTGLTSVDGAIYLTNVTVGFNPGGVIVDDTNILMRAGSIEEMDYKGRFMVDGENKVYVHLWDDSDPNEATLEFNRYPTDQFGGLFEIEEEVSGYVNISNIEVKGSYGIGFKISDDHVNLTDVLSHFNGRENFYFEANSTSDLGAHNSVCRNCVAQWSNTKETRSTGQNVTIEAPYVDYIGGSIEYGAKAGFSVLNYDVDTDPQFVRLIGTTVRYNSRRGIEGDTNGNDPQVYNDGGHDVYLINANVIGNAFLSGYPVATQNPSNGVAIGSEHPNDYPAYNTYLINTLVHSNSFNAIQTKNVFNTGTNNIGKVYLSNVTLSSGNYYNVDFSNIDPSGDGVFVYNSVIFTNSNSQSYMPANYTGNNNIWYNKSSAQLFQLAGQNKSFSEFQSITGEEGDSFNVNPSFVATGSYYFALKNTLAGDASTSVGVDAGNVNYLNELGLSFYEIGSTRKDLVLDSLNSLDIGYHYTANFWCSKAWWDDDGSCGKFINIPNATLPNFTVVPQ